MSTDINYERPPLKNTAAVNVDNTRITDYEVFCILDKLKPTATGLDGLPAWFLRIAAPVFCGPIADLINLSLMKSTVPSQWKQVRIRPVPKTSTPLQPADYRPISITPVLARLMERFVVRRYIYPALSSPPPTLQFNDQFAFRPTGSTTAAIIHLLNAVINMLSNEPYVIVISLDFSKAFDTVRHSTLLHKLSLLDLPDHVYNWLTDVFSGRSHCTVFNQQQSSFQNITASIIQGSALGPAAYVVTAGDLTTVEPGNELCKYADDTYIIIPASNVDTRQAELDNISTWAQKNNLRLNCAKSCEVVFSNTRRRRRQFEQPPPLPGIKRQHSLKMLGVHIADDFSVGQHVQRLTTSCAQTLYALRVLRHHGMNNSDLQLVFRAVVVARLTYAASAWRGFITAASRQRINALTDRAKRLGYCAEDLPTVDELCDVADDDLFYKIVCYSNHVLHNIIPPPSTASQHYNLRPRTHSLQLTEHTTHLSDCNFITRMLYKNVY